MIVTIVEEEDPLTSSFLLFSLLTPPLGGNISYLSFYSLLEFYSYPSSSLLMSNSLSLSTSLPASSLLLLLLFLLIRHWWHFDKYLSPSPWYHYWRIAVGYLHLAFSVTLYINYGGRILTTSLPAYPTWRHRLRSQLWWGKQLFPRVHYFPILYLLSPPGASLHTKAWESWGRGAPPLPTPPLSIP